MLCLGQLVLKVEAADARQPDIEHKAARNVRKLGSGAVREPKRTPRHSDLHRAEQVRQRDPHGLVVIDNKNDRLKTWSFCSIYRPPASAPEQCPGERSHSGSNEGQMFESPALPVA